MIVMNQDRVRGRNTPHHIKNFIFKAVQVSGIDGIDIIISLRAISEVSRPTS
jgi:hypothetical protein